MANCPICGRHINEFSNDPLLATPSLSTDEFKGFTQLIRTHIEELQTERHQQEIDNGITPLTVFSPINNSGFFQNIKQYILELRSSTQKILDATGMSLHDFLSTDEDGNPMTSKDDWTDSNLEEIKYQCKAIHIEDLRHFISIVNYFKENWEDSPVIQYFTGASFIGQDSKTWIYNPRFSALGSYLEITSIKDSYLYLIPGMIDDVGIQLRYVDDGRESFKLKTNSKFYFDLNLISIPIDIHSGYSYDDFHILIRVRTVYKTPPQEFSISYHFNYHPTLFYWVLVPSPYHILGGTIGIGTTIKNIYNDLINANTGMINYYNGVIDDKGTFVTQMYIEMGCTSLLIHEVKVDNIKIKL